MRCPSWIVFILLCSAAGCAPFGEEQSPRSTNDSIETEAGDPSEDDDEGVGTERDGTERGGTSARRKDAGVGAGAGADAGADASEPEACLLGLLCVKRDR